MFTELFNAPPSTVYLFDAKSRRFALIPEAKRPAFLAYHYRHFVILLIFSLLSLTPSLTEWRNLIICLALYCAMTWYYLTRLTPQADWQALDTSDPAYPVFAKRFALTKVKLNASFYSLASLAIIVGIANRMQAQETIILESLLLLALIYEAIRQTVIYWQLRQNPLTLEVEPNLRVPLTKNKKVKK